MNWLKENWFKVIILVILSFLVYAVLSSGDSELQNKGNLNFKINVNALSYSLPQHTSMCIPETKQYCTSDGKCENIEPTVFILYDQNKSMVYRCDEKPCDGYEVKSTQSGLFELLRPIGDQELEIKISQNDEFVETVGFGLDRYISYGNCVSNDSVTMQNEWLLSLYDSGTTIWRANYDTKNTCLSAGSSHIADGEIDRFDCGFNCKSDDINNLLESPVCELVCNAGGCR